MRAVWSWVLAGTCVLALGCEARVSLGAPCATAMDCFAGQVCGVGGRCRAECTTSADCGGGSCLRDPVTERLGCSLPDEVPPGDAGVGDAGPIDAGAPDAGAPDVGTAACPEGGTLDVDVGRGAVCAIGCDHQVRCWGGWSEATRRLVPAPEDCGGVPCITRPVEVPLPAAVEPTEITVGEHRACVRDAEGAVFCWGYLTDTAIDAPVQILAAGGVAFRASEVRSGGWHTCAREQADPSRVSCWGTNDYGQLGVGGMAASPAAVRSFEDVAILATGAWRTHVVRADGAVTGVGENPFAEVRAPHSAAELTPVACPALPGVIEDFAALDRESCAVLSSGDLACWGRVSPVLGPLPVPDTTMCGTEPCTGTPRVLPRGFLSAGPPAGMAGDRFAPVLLVWDAEGVLYGVGQSDAGVLGGDPRAYEPRQTTALVGRPTHHVAVGFETACAILDGSRQLVCWGANDVGQLGRGATGAPQLVAEPPAW